MYKNGIPKTRRFVKNAPNQPSKVRTRNWVEINDESRGTYTSNSIKYITTMLRSNLCDYADASILVKGTITIIGNAAPEPNPDAARTVAQSLAAREADEMDKGVILKNCVPFAKS